MDDQVRKALARWPGVPSVYGWLSLDQRGRWRLKGEPIIHEGTKRFIARNYEVDPRGAWFFQNGPQRVYVALECAPWIYQLMPNGRLKAHTGTGELTPTGLWLDERGGLWLMTTLGIGVLHHHDLDPVADWLRGPSGGLMDELILHEAYTRILEAAPRGECDLGLTCEWPSCEWPGGPLKVGGIRRASTPEHFGFLTDPAPDNDPGTRDQGSGGA